MAQLLQWRLGLADAQTEPLAPEAIRDWLWLAAQLEQAPLPQRYARSSDPGRSAVEANHPEGSAVSPSDDPRPLPPPPSSPDRAAPDPSLPTPWPLEPEPQALPQERLARLLSDAALLPDAAAVAEALPLQIRELPLLPDPGGLLRALRPLLPKRPHPRWRVLDEERSAVSSYEKRMAWPVFRPRRVPMVALRLVLDGGVPMAVWEPLARELQRVLASSQAFARVELEQLQPERLPRRQPPRAAEAETSLTLLLSDTAGPHWWDGSIVRWLEMASRDQPLVILHLLPQRYWKASALQQALELTLTNREPLAANRRYRRLLPVRDPYSETSEASAGCPPELDPQTLALPVISLDAHELASWAALVAGQPRARCAGRAWPKPFSHASPPSAVEFDHAARGDALWEVFEQRASPAARQLLLSMAASTLLTLPILRLLLASVAPEAFSPVPLAEVLLSGLVLRLPDPDGAGASLERVQFALPPELRRLLEPHLEPERRRQVLDAVTGLLERHWDRNRRGPGFRALVLGPKEELERDHPDLHHIANVTAAMLDQLPGEPFSKLAAQLRGVEPPRPQRPLWPAAMAFEEESFAAAQLVAVPPLEPIRYSAAQLQELALQPIHGTWGFHEPLQREALPFAATAEQAGPLCLTLIQIKAGDFLMGSPADEPERFSGEGPQHAVIIQEFFMAQTPITQAQWREVAGWREREGETWARELMPNPSHFGNKADSDQRPVEQVSWLDAMEFCHRLSQRTGRHYTLPSEAQWEYACRAGSTTPFAFGATLTAELANYNAISTYGDAPKGEYRGQTTPVGMFAGNAWGLQDMHGNVLEWCLDEWHGNYEGAPTDGSAWLNPTATSNEAITKGETKGNDEETRLLRGGSWLSIPRNCRSAYRYHLVPGNAHYHVGFRVVCLPQGPSLNA
ncbi:MAG: SAV_2336 N-terminal domain-related protein [Synechococcaceae cyanobacterium]